MTIVRGKVNVTARPVAIVTGHAHFIEPVEASVFPVAITRPAREIERIREAAPAIADDATLESLRTAWRLKLECVDPLESQPNRQTRISRASASASR